MIKRLARMLGYVKVGYPHFGIDVTITYRDHFGRDRAIPMHLEPESKWSLSVGSEARSPHAIPYEFARREP